MTSKKRRSPSSQAIIVDVCVMLVSTVLTSLLALWARDGGLSQLLPFSLAQGALLWSAWRLRQIGLAPQRHDLLRIAVMMTTAMCALLWPLFTLSFAVKIMGVGTHHSALSGTPAEPAIILILLAFSAVYPLMLLWHLLSPRPSRWDDEGAVASALRTNAIAGDLSILILSSWLIALDFPASAGHDPVTRTVAILAVYVVLALPRLTVLASRLRVRSLVSLALLLGLQLLQTIW